VHRVGERGAHHSSPFDDGPTDGVAPPDERTVRHIESAERSKQKHKQHALAELDILANRTHHSAAGCILSPFAGDVLKNMYASKQFSFRRSNTNSSYSRYDSFLNGSISEGGENDSIMDGRIAEVMGTDGTATAATRNSFRSGEDDSVPISVDEEGIFRPSPTEQRLRSLLRHAGFSTPKGMLQEAEEDVLSLDNSVGRLLLRGGPSFREAHVFRGESDDEVEQGQPEIVEVKTKVSDLLHWITSCCSAVAHTTF
jgi:hypothetical protein